MMRGRVRIGRVRGIPIRVDASWIVIFVLLTWSMARSVFPGMFPHWSPALTWGTAVVTALLFSSPS